MATTMSTVGTHESQTRSPRGKRALAKNKQRRGGSRGGHGATQGRRISVRVKKLRAVLGIGDQEQRTVRPHRLLPLRPSHCSPENSQQAVHVVSPAHLETAYVRPAAPALVFVPAYAMPPNAYHHHARSFSRHAVDVGGGTAHCGKSSTPENRRSRGAWGAAARGAQRDAFGLGKRGHCGWRPQESVRLARASVRGAKVSDSLAWCIG